MGLGGGHGYGRGWLLDWAGVRPKPTLGWLSELGGNEAISCRSASWWLMSALVTGEEQHPTRF